jgi:hypothetical protein
MDPRTTLKNSLTTSETYNNLDALLAYPQTELYRLIVDGQFHKKEQGYAGYEQRQPGSLKAAFDGLALAITDLEDTALSVSFIKKLHFTCMSHVDHLKAGTVPGKIRKENQIVGFYMPPHTITAGGLYDLFKFIEQQTQYKNPEHGSWIGPSIEDESVGENTKGIKSIDRMRSINHKKLDFIRDVYNCETLQQLAEKKHSEAQYNDFNHYIAPHSNKLSQDLKNAVAKYNTDIKLAATQDQKLETIVELVWTCDHIHPFMDGNIRTFAVILLTRLLLQNGFPPVTLLDPNVFDCFSKAELVDVLKQGIKNTLALIDGEKELFGFCSKNMSDDDRADLMKHHAANFITALNEESARLKIEAIEEEIIATWGKTNTHSLFKSVTLQDGTPDHIKQQWKLIHSAEKHKNYQEALNLILTLDTNESTHTIAHHKK